MASFRFIAMALAAVMLGGAGADVATEMISAKLMDIEQFVRADDALDRAETDAIVGMEGTALRTAEAEQRAFAESVKYAVDEAVSSEGKVAASGAMREALVEETRFIEAAVASHNTDCLKTEEAQGNRVAAIKARQAAVANLLAELVQPFYTALETDPCAFTGSQASKAGCNGCLDPQHCDTCVFDAAQTHCYTAAAAKGDKALNKDDVETAVSQLRNLTSVLDDELLVAMKQAAMPSTACADEQDQRLLLSVVTAAISELDRQVIEWNETADYKRRQLIAAEPITQAKAAAVDATRARVQQTADAYQTRRNTRVATMLCDTEMLRQALTSPDEGAIELSTETMKLLPGPAQYPGATVPANGLEKCELRAVELENAQLTLPEGRPPIVYRGGPGLDPTWAMKPNLPHVEPRRAVDIDA